MNELFLIFTQSPNGALSVALSYPFPYRGKSCYFIKKCCATLDNFVDNADNNDGGSTEGNGAIFQSVCMAIRVFLAVKLNS